jgi:hypothetical protein
LYSGVTEQDGVGGANALFEFDDGCGWSFFFVLIEDWDAVQIKDFELCVGRNQLLGCAQGQAVVGALPQAPGYAKNG